MNLKLLQKNLRFEIIYRLKLALFMSCLVIFILLNFIEHLNNYLFFYTEINLNELEYVHYNSLYYNNNLNINIIEYDWYVNYNIFPISFLTNKNTLIWIYIFIFFLIMLPYLIYEVYLFVIPATYLYEKNKIKFWIFYTFTLFCLYLIYMDKTSSDFFFYWNEDSYVYIYNEWIDIFFNINNISNLYLFNICFFFFLSQFVFVYINFINNYKYIKITNKKLRIYINFLFLIYLISLYFFITIELLFIVKYIIILFIITELLLYLRSINFLYYNAK
jgi:hypothetical protein